MAGADQPAWKRLYPGATPVRTPEGVRCPVSSKVLDGIVIGVIACQYTSARALAEGHGITVDEAVEVLRFLSDQGVISARPVTDNGYAVFPGRGDRDETRKRLARHAASTPSSPSPRPDRAAA